MVSMFLVGVVFEGNSSFLLKVDSTGKVDFFKEFTDLTARAYFLISVLQTASGFMIGGTKQASRLFYKLIPYSNRCSRK